MISKKVLIPMAAVAVIGAGLYGVSQVSAASSGTGQTLAQKIASTFNLDPSKVQGVISQYRGDQSAQRETDYETRLKQAVTDGKLTSAQESAILAEHNTLESAQQAAMQQTGSARRTAMQKVRADAQAWATANNIDAKWLLGPRPLRGGRDQGGPNGPSGVAPNDGSAPATSPTPSTSAAPSSSD